MRRKREADTSAAYTVPEAAPFIRSGPRALYKLIEEGIVPHIKIGGKIIIPKAAFHRWLDSAGQ